MLSVTNLTFKVHNKIIFNNISSIFNNGEIIGITGAAGSGKRTFINLLCSKKRKYQGIISIDDCNIENISKRNYNKLVSHYSSSQETINPEAVVKEWIDRCCALQVAGRALGEFSPQSVPADGLQEREMVVPGARYHP